MKSWLEENKFSLVLALAGLILFGGGVFWLKTSWEPETQVEILSASTDQKQTNDIYVDVSGAVNNPGVYQLESRSRVDDALWAAGGLASDAHTQWIESNLNRAMVLTDGVKIYIPSQSELVKSSNEKTSLNSATKPELESLAGVGPAIAEKIVSHRPYQTIEELLSKKIVGQKTFAAIKDKVSVW